LIFIFVNNHHFFGQQRNCDNVIETFLQKEKQKITLAKFYEKTTTQEQTWHALVSPIRLAHQTH